MHVEAEKVTDSVREEERVRTFGDEVLCRCTSEDAQFEEAFGDGGA